MAVFALSNIVSASDKPLSELIAPLRKYSQSGEINSRTAKPPKEILAALAAVAGCGEKDGSAEYAKGVNLFDKKDFEAAAAEFSECIALAPDNVDAKLMLARTMTALGDLPKAVKAAEDALALEPKAVDAKMLVAETAFYARDYKKARKHFGDIANDVSLAVEARSAGECGLAVVDIGAKPVAQTFVQRKARA